MSGTFQSAIRSSRSSRRSSPPKGARLVVIGNGMVGAKFCEALIDQKLHRRFEVTVIGEEPRPAYNRVKLSTYVDHRVAENLEIQPRTWYEEHGLSLITGVRAEEINRQEKSVKTNSGDSIPYDLLVLATGSSPFVPPVPGADLDDVHLYRTLEDLEEIIAASSGKKSAAIIGGGLLGLEAAQALQSLGLKTTVIERANFLMPRQLNERAAKILHHQVFDQEIDLHLGIQSTQIIKGDEGVILQLDEHAPLHADFVVISAGISPNSQLATEAVLSTGVRGGIVVNDHLETEDESIFAIGECALLHGQIYGLVAPGYLMAKHLAARLKGKKVAPLPPLDLSTRLKMLGVDVTTIGEPLQEGRRVEYEEEGVYRLITLGPKRRFLGALAIGLWVESGKIQNLIGGQSSLSRKQEESFLETGSVFPGKGMEDPTAWPESRIVCNCVGVTKGQISACLMSCQQDPDRIAKETGASTVCGSCHPLLEQLCGATPGEVKKPRIAIAALLGTSALAFLAVLYSVIFPGAPMADSVASTWWKVNQLWRDNFIKQITGYSLVGIFLIGLIISLRKRFSWFTWGKFTTWRFFHAAFGLVSLGALWMHTGFHFGANLNFWLMAVFVALNLLGALAGIITALESKGTWPAARRLRPILTWAHIILFWPLPVLITFHVMSVYLY